MSIQDMMARNPMDMEEKNISEWIQEDYIVLILPMSQALVFDRTQTLNFITQTSNSDSYECRSENNMSQEGPPLVDLYSLGHTGHAFILKKDFLRIFRNTSPNKIFECIMQKHLPIVGTRRRGLDSSHGVNCQEYNNGPLFTMSERTLFTMREPNRRRARSDSDEYSNRNQRRRLNNDSPANSPEEDEDLRQAIMRSLENGSGSGSSSRPSPQDLPTVGERQAYSDFVMTERSFVFTPESDDLLTMFNFESPALSQDDTVFLYTCFRHRTNYDTAMEEHIGSLVNNITNAVSLREANDGIAKITNSTHTMFARGGANVFKPVLQELQISSNRLANEDASFIYNNITFLNEVN